MQKIPISSVKDTAITNPIIHGNQVTLPFENTIAFIWQRKAVVLPLFAALAMSVGAAGVAVMVTINGCLGQLSYGRHGSGNGTSSKTVHGKTQKRVNGIILLQYDNRPWDDE